MTSPECGRILNCLAFHFLTPFNKASRVHKSIPRRFDQRALPINTFVIGLDSAAIFFQPRFPFGFLHRGFDACFSGSGRIEAAVRAGELPATHGFFFGESDGTERMILPSSPRRARPSLKATRSITTRGGDIPGRGGNAPTFGSDTVRTGSRRRRTMVPRPHADTSHPPARVSTS